jgi:hypothetical protein
MNGAEDREDLRKGDHVERLTWSFLAAALKRPGIPTYMLETWV